MTEIAAGSDDWPAVPRQADIPPGAIVRQIDHVILLCDDLPTVRELFQFFSQTLGFPIAWPLESYPSTRLNPGGFTSGGLFPGNVFIEVLFIAMSGPVRRLFSKRPPRFAAIAYEPWTLDAALAAIEQRELQATDPVPYIFDPARFRSLQVRNIGPPTIEPISTPEQLPRRGELAMAKYSRFREPVMPGYETLYQTVWFESDYCGRLQSLKRWCAGWILPQIFDVAIHASAKEGIQTFLCDFNPLHIDIDAFRQNLLSVLQRLDGGPLGVMTMDQIVVATGRFAHQDEFFQKLLDPISAEAPGVWRAGDSPAIRLEDVADESVPRGAPRECIDRVVFKVRDLTRTRKYLAQKGLLASDCSMLEDPESELRLEPAAVKGLSLHFRE